MEQTTTTNLSSRLELVFKIFCFFIKAISQEGTAYVDNLSVRSFDFAM